MIISDKKFVPYISHSEIETQVARMATELTIDYETKSPLFLAVLNGSYVFAADLLKCLNFPVEISFIKLASYHGTESTGDVKQIVGLNENVEGRDVIIIEDIVDSGLTMEVLYNILSEAKVKSVSIVSMLFKPSNYKASLKIKYVGMEIPDYFVVGYGMDYNGFGRNLKEIYRLQ